MIKFFYTIGLLIIVSFCDCYGQSSNGFDKSRVFKYLKDSQYVDGQLIGGMYNLETPRFKSDISKYTKRVENKAQFISALKEAKAGDVIFINGGSSIDLSGGKSYVIPAGVTLVSNRGANGSQGALLYSKTPGTRPLLTIGGSNVKISGIRLLGFDTQEFPKGLNVSKLNNNRKTYSVAVTQGIASKFSNLEIYNCEISGWTHAGIFLSNGAKDIYIHHNYIHSNKRFGLGYGVGLDNAVVKIKANIFDDNRHDVAGTGVAGTSYDASYNIVFGDRDNHLFDMHGGADRKDNTNIAGSDIKIYNNYFMIRSGGRAITIRGIPLKQADIRDNVIFETKKMLQSRSLRMASRKNEKRVETFVSQINSFGNVQVSNNKVIELN